MRLYDRAELAALRAVNNREWKGSGDPAAQGPAQFAGGPYWPEEMRRKAREFDRLAPLYRLAADALEREIASGRDGNNPAPVVARPAPQTEGERDR